jgi:hypothetical protein
VVFRATPTVISRDTTTNLYLGPECPRGIPCRWRGCAAVRAILCLAIGHVKQNDFALQTNHRSGQLTGLTNDRFIDGAQLSTNTVSSHARAFPWQGSSCHANNQPVPGAQTRRGRGCGRAGHPPMVLGC